MEVIPSRCDVQRNQLSIRIFILSGGFIPPLFLFFSTQSILTISITIYHRVIMTDKKVFVRVPVQVSAGSTILCGVTDEGEVIPLACDKQGRLLIKQG